MVSSALAEGEADTLPEAERELALRADDSLETALRAFDTSEAERIPVVDRAERGRKIGWASWMRARARLNQELIALSVEETPVILA